MLIIILSFLSGILSVLAPCVLPVIPVLFGGGLGANDRGKIHRILFSTLVFIFIFTFLLKVSTAFITISTQTRATISGAIIILYSGTLLFPAGRERIQSKIPQINTSGNNGKWGDILLGASLGPIFATCSPTYLLLISTILPASLTIGIVGLIAYLVGFGGFLYLLIIGGRSIIKKFYGLADTHGRFKKILGILLLVTGVLIMTGLMKQLEAKLITILPDSGRIEVHLQKMLDLYPFKEKPQTNTSETTNLLPSTKTMHRGYQPYDENNIPTTGDIVLFFHADRCPTCNEAEKNFLQNDIPEGLTILKVDFDTARDLKQKYGILTQTSYVLIRPDGSMIKRWIGGRTIEEITKKVAEAKIDLPVLQSKKSSGITAIAYLAGGCFWCMEGPFEAMEGVKEVISGYAGGEKSTASYKLVSRGDTGHKEAVKIVYDPGIVSFEELLAVYRTQIDPTDDAGQFADRGSQYIPAIYYQTSEEQQLAEQSKIRLQEAKLFDDDIVVPIIPFTSFYEAEAEHQNFYKKEADYYSRYKKGSGRAGFVDTHETDVKTLFERSQNSPDLSHLTEQQKDVLFNGGTEPPFNNAYRDHHATGIYVDVIDGTPLFSSLDKFDSGTGRPSFTRPIDEALVSSHTDNSLRMERTEIKSATSNGHLGHVFDDGPQDKGGKRYCINSAALRFVPLEEMNTPAYEKYLVLFTGK